MLYWIKGIFFSFFSFFLSQIHRGQRKNWFMRFFIRFIFSFKSASCINSSNYPIFLFSSRCFLSFLWCFLLIWWEVGYHCMRMMLFLLLKDIFILFFLSLVSTIWKFNFKRIKPKFFLDHRMRMIKVSNCMNPCFNWCLMVFFFLLYF